MSTMSEPMCMSSNSTSVSGRPRSPMVGSRRPITSPGVSSRIARNPPMPSSSPCSSNTRANTRWSLDTPPPVIQCFLPFRTYRSPRRSARVVIIEAALPAPGSVMQMAGLSPSSTRPAARRLWSSEPYAMIAEMAPMLASTAIRPVTPHCFDISSTTRTASRNEQPGPPNSAGTVMPVMPASRSASTFSHGYDSVRSTSAARGPTTSVATARALACRSSCFSVSSHIRGFLQSSWRRPGRASSVPVRLPPSFRPGRLRGSRSVPGYPSDGAPPRKR